MGYCRPAARWYARASSRCGLKKQIHARRRRIRADGESRMSRKHDRLARLIDNSPLRSPTRQLSIRMGSWSPHIPHQIRVVGSTWCFRDYLGGLGKLGRQFELNTVRVGQIAMFRGQLTSAITLDREGCGVAPPSCLTFHFHSWNVTRAQPCNSQRSQPRS